MIKGTGRILGKGSSSLGQGDGRSLISSRVKRMRPQRLYRSLTQLQHKGTEVWAVGGSAGILPELSSVSPRPPVCAHSCGPGTESCDLGCSPAGPGCPPEEPLTRRCQKFRPSSCAHLGMGHGVWMTGQP